MTIRVYPTRTITRSIYPPLRAERQAVIEINMINVGHNEYDWYEFFPGTYSFMFSPRTDYVYVYIYSETIVTVVLMNPAFGEIRIELRRGSREMVLNTWGQPIDVVVTKEDGYVYIYLCEGIMIAGERVVARVTPRSFNELFRIYGDNLIGKYTHMVHFELNTLIVYESIDFYVNGEYYGGWLFGDFDLDGDIVVTARGRGFISYYGVVQVKEFTLDVDTAYIYPVNVDVVSEGEWYWDRPCIYKKPVLYPLPPSPRVEEPPWVLVVEVADEMKQHQFMDTIMDLCRTPPRGIAH